MRLATSDTLAARHQRLRDALRAGHLDGLVVTHLPNLFYLTNVQATAGLVVVTLEAVYLVLDFRYHAAARALGSTGNACPGAELILVERSYDESLCKLIQSLGRARMGIEGAHLPLNRVHHLATASGAALEVGGRSLLSESTNGPVLVATDGVLERLRLVKDAHEIDMLRQGARLISSVARDVILHEVRPGLSEREVAARIDWRIKASGFERCSFETIVASGSNAALPHAHPGDRRLTDGDLVVLDFGGVYGGYCVDLTRTLALGEPDAEMERVHGAVLEAQQAAIAAVRPGVPVGDIDLAARSTLARHGLADAFGHSTGHGLGIEIHETPRIAPRREPTVGTAAQDEVVEPGMVFTVEPGAYLPGWGGVRIEDDVLVTAGSVEVLTDVPRGLRAS